MVNAINKLRNHKRTTVSEADGNDHSSKSARDSSSSNESVLDFLKKLHNEMQNLKSDVLDLRTKLQEGKTPDSAITSSSNDSSDSQNDKVPISALKWLASPDIVFPSEILNASARGLAALENLPKIKCARNIPSK